MRIQTRVVSRGNNTFALHYCHYEVAGDEQSILIWDIFQVTHEHELSSVSLESITKSVKIHFKWSNWKTEIEFIDYSAESGLKVLLQKLLF